MPATMTQCDGADLTRGWFHPPAACRATRLQHAYGVVQACSSVWGRAKLLCAPPAGDSGLPASSSCVLSQRAAGRLWMVGLLTAAGSRCGGRRTADRSLTSSLQPPDGQGRRGGPASSASSIARSGSSSPAPSGLAGVGVAALLTAEVDEVAVTRLVQCCQQVPR